MRIRKYSQKREAILLKIQSTDCHPTADWVFQELRGEYPDLSLATVYRNLALFEEEGTITSIGSINGQERFDGITYPHGHFICRQCYCIFDIMLNAEQLSLAAIFESDSLYKVERMDVTAYGLCMTCFKQ